MISENKNKKRKAALSGLAALTMLLTLAGTGCGKKEEPVKDTIQIGVTMYDEYDTFIAQMMNSFMEKVSEQTKKGRSINVKRYNAAGNQITQNEQVEEMLEKGCDVICVNLVDRTDPAMIIEAARNADVPVIFFNRELVEKDLKSWDKLYYVGADAFESGIIQGQIVAEAWKETLHTDKTMDKNDDGILSYAILEGEAGHQDAIVRTEYSVDELVNAGIAIDKCDSEIANWNRSQAKTKTTQILNKCGDRLELILCNNDDMALGAIDAMETLEIPKEEWPVVVGIDGTDVGLEAVVNGTMLGTVYNDKEGQAGAMLNLAIAVVTGEGYEDIDYLDGKVIRYPYFRITADNIEDYLK